MTSRAPTIVAVLLAFLVVGPVQADDKQRESFEQEQSDHALIQGIWKVEKAVHSGEEMPGYMVLEFKRDKVIPRRNGNADTEADFKIDVSRMPRRMDLKTPDGMKMAGIYEIQGETLKLCFTREGEGVRPTKFESPAKSQSVLIIMKRQKK